MTNASDRERGGWRRLLRHFPSASPHIPRPPMTVLIVDPDTERAQQLALALQPYAIVGVVSSAQAAYASLAARLPDLILLDLSLPDVDGVEFIGHLHRTAATHHVLLMVVTARSSVHDKIAALAAGADDYLVWPLDLSEVVTHVGLLSRFRRMLTL